MTAITFHNVFYRYQKTFTHSASKAKRFEIFKQNLKHIDELNRRHNTTNMFGINAFSDYEPFEFRKVLIFLLF